MADSCRMTTDKNKLMKTLHLINSVLIPQLEFYFQHNAVTYVFTILYEQLFKGDDIIKMHWDKLCRFRHFDEPMP